MRPLRKAVLFARGGLGTIFQKQALSENYERHSFQVTEQALRLPVAYQAFFHFHLTQITRSENLSTMASSTRSRANARSSVTQSLLGSEKESTGLHGPVPPDTHNSPTEWHIPLAFRQHRPSQTGFNPQHLSHASKSFTTIVSNHARNSL
jgi:hypothetical protein